MIRIAATAPMRHCIFAALLTLGSVCSGQAEAADPEPPQQFEIRSEQGVWEPGPDGAQIALWPEDMDLAQPDTGARPEETGNGSGAVGGRMWHWAGSVTRPTMTIYKPKGEGNGATMLVLPGGGYTVLAMDLEGTEICDWVTAKGMTCVILKYRVPQAWTANADDVREPPEPLLAIEDAQRALGLLRAGAGEYGIDPAKIGVIGFSAGAHLAAAISNADARAYPKVDAADDLSLRPDSAVIMYTGRLWYTANEPTDLSLGPWVHISDRAPPTLLIHSMTDPVNDVRHPIAYALALQKAGVPVDLRLYSGGGHAFGLRESDEPITTQWPGEVEQWLGNIGVL